MWLIRLFWNVTRQEIRQNIQDISPPLLSRPHHLDWPVTTAYSLDLTLISSCKYLLCLVNGLELLWGGCVVGCLWCMQVWSRLCSLCWWCDLSPPLPVRHRLMKQTVFTKHMQLHRLHAVRGKFIAPLSDDATRKGHRQLWDALGSFTERCNITLDMKDKVCLYFKSCEILKMQLAWVYLFI